jgi:signal transduction histidine kinase
MPDTRKEIIFAVLFATVLFFLLVGFIVAYLIIYRRKRKQHAFEMNLSKKEFEQQLLQSQVEVQENTFKHIAKELHDNIGQLLSTTKMLLGVTEMNLPFVSETLIAANDTLSKAIQELRSVSRSLDKEWLEQFNFSENLQNEIKTIEAGGTVSVSLIQQASYDASNNEQLILFRVVQEALQNALRHAQPRHIRIEIRENDTICLIKIYNDGQSIQNNFHGMGTNNMKHRVQLLGGQIAWQAAKQGTLVKIDLPFKRRI